MPTATKARKSAPVVEDDEEDEEPVVRKPKASTATKTKTAVAAKKPRPSEQAMAEATAERRTKKVAAAPRSSARDYVLAILTEGAPRDEVKKRAIALAKSDKADVSFKTFDVAYYLKHLEGKGYRLIEKNGNVRVIAPKG